MTEIISIIYICQVILALISVIISIIEYIITKNDYGTGTIFLFLFLLNIIPIIGAWFSVSLCADCISNIKKL